MGGTVLLLTGVPGSGKTTVSTYIAERYSPFTVISFGDVILDIKRRSRPAASRDELRSHPSKAADTSLIKEATTSLLYQVASLRQSTNVVIDSHAVAQDAFGFRVTPDSQDTLRELRLDAVLVLHADHSKIVQRIEHDPAGRRLVSESQVATHERLQDATAIAYAVVSGCPVFVVEARGNTQVVAGLVLQVMDSLGATYTRSTHDHDRQE